MPTGERGHSCANYWGPDRLLEQILEKERVGVESPGQQRERLQRKKPLWCGQRWEPGVGVGEAAGSFGPLRPPRSGLVLSHRVCTLEILKSFLDLGYLHWRPGDSCGQSYGMGMVC